jgi:mono/diheme cytochrome c family protein
MHKLSVALGSNFFPRREEKQILRCAQDDLSFRAKRSGARNLLLVAALGRVVILMPGILIAGTLLIVTTRLRGGEPPAGIPGGPEAPAVPLTAALGVEFVKGSTSTVVLDRGGKKYLVDLVANTIREVEPAATSPAGEMGQAKPPALRAGQPDGSAIFKQKCSPCHGADGKGIPAIKTPDFTKHEVQASITDEQILATIRNGRTGTLMPAWGGKLSDQEIQAVAGHIRSFGTPNQPGQTTTAQAAEGTQPKVYTPGDDFLLSLPTGRRLDRHGFYVNFTHRFVYTPAFSGPALGGSLSGFDDFSISSFGFRYGVTDKLSVSIYRSPTFIARPIQLMAAYNFMDEHDGYPLNAVVRVSIEGENNFSRNFTENIEGILSRSISSRAQLYLVPTLSLGNRELFQPSSFFSSAIPNLPGVNTFSLGVGGAIDIRPTVALLAEVIPTLANGDALGIHRPAFGFAIQKKIWRHAFTFGFTTSPGTTVSQRAGTRAQFLGQPNADTPAGLCIGFDLMRQIF